MKSYDYVIFGAGSAGAALANRLSEDKDASVLLLEEGGSWAHKDSLIRMPIAFLKANVRLGEHPSCTCAMGTGEAAVVDPQLRVHGVDGLRVADTSVMPHLTSGNTNIPTIMIAEKAADLIRGRTLSPGPAAASIADDTHRALVPLES